MTREHAEALLAKHGRHLVGWQRRAFVELVEGVEYQTVRGRGRRAGWTVLLRAVEDALKDRDGSIRWDGEEAP